jgi:hypothetical protein
MIKQKIFLILAFLAVTLAATISNNILEARTLHPEEGIYCIISEGNPNYAVDVRYGGQASKETPIWIYHKNNSDAQIFQIKKVRRGWYKIIHVRSGFLISVQNGNANNDARLWLYHDDETPSCYWKFIDAGHGACIIQSQISTHKVFDLPNNDAYNGATLHLWEQHKGQSAKWRLIKM